jgi:microsomal dipeptidase-like Zn-dependent dipeptidase
MTTTSPELTRLTHVDGLLSGGFGREQLEALHAGRMSCVTVTCGFWDDAVEGIDAVVRWRDLLEANADIAGLARSTADIQRLNEEGRVAVLLGFQNSSMLQGRIRYVQVFAELGVRVVQLTYNNQNDVGSSCYEPTDGGLTRFGHEVVDELNRHHVLIDLSHVGERTSFDAIAASSAPVAITHANAHSLYAHPRNKSDELIRALAARGGVIGCALYPNLVGPYFSATVERFSEMVARTCDIAGVAHVGIGSDLGGTTTPADLKWMREGRWTRHVNHGAASASAPGDDDPLWFPSMARMPDVAEALGRRGLSTPEVHAVMAGNFKRLYSEVIR